MTQDEAPVHADVSTRRWWLVGVLIGLPIIVYLAVYMLCSERGTTPDMRPVMPFTFLDHHLIVRTPKNLCGVFVPAAYAEAVVKGCWRGVLVVDGEGTTWDLSTHPWRFRRSWIDTTNIPLIQPTP